MITLWEGSVALYRIRCAVTGKCYFGITRNPIAVRWAQHRKEARAGRFDTVLYRAIRAHGHENFTIAAEQVYATAGEAQLAEREAIIANSTLAPGGMNSSTGGESWAGRRVTDEVRAKISKAKKGKRLSPEAVAKSAAARTGIKATDAARASHRRAMKDSAVRAACIAPLLIHRNSPMRLRKASETMRKLWLQPEFRQAQADRLRELNRRRQEAKRLREESTPPPRTRHEAMLERWSDDAYRDRMVNMLQARETSPERVAHLRALTEARRGRPLTAEHKAAIAAALTGRKRGPYKRKEKPLADADVGAAAGGRR